MRVPALERDIPSCDFYACLPDESRLRASASAAKPKMLRLVTQKP